MNTEDKENLFRVQFTKETNHILHDYDIHGMYEKGFHAKYVEWLEAKLKNLGEGEAGTSYALLSDVADLNNLKCCGNCLHRNHSDNCCELQHTWRENWQVCEDWKYDLNNYAYRSE